MARPGITRKDVFEIANQLVGEGIIPTIEQIRLRLGTGSNSTIAQFFREWKNNNQSGSDIQEEIPAEITGLMKGLWKRLLTESEQKIIILRNDFEQILTPLQAQLKQTQEALLTLEESQTSLIEEKKHLTREMNALTSHLQEKEKKNTQLEDNQKQLHVQLTEKQDLIADLRRLHRQAQENLEHYREESRLQRLQDTERHIVEMDLKQQEIKTLQEQFTLSQQALFDFKVLNEKLNQEKINLDQHINQLKHQCSQMMKQIQTYENDLNIKNLFIYNFQNDNAILQKNLAEKTLFIANLEKQSTLTQQQLFDKENQLKQLQQDNQLLSQQKWALSQEKSNLLGQLTQLKQWIQLKEDLSVTDEP